MESGRTVSLLIPYKFIEGETLVYLQKKSENAPRLPGYFGFWGGGEELSESPEQALKREIKEELGIDPEGYIFFKRYEQEAIKNVYICEVDDTFENKIKISEGDYGKWFSESEASAELKLSDGDKIVLGEVYKNFKK